MIAPAEELARLAVLRARLRAKGATIEPDRPSFVNPQQVAFFDSQAPEILYSGAFRAGKSRVGCEKAWYLARRYPGIPIGIFRKVAATIERSTQQTLLHDVIPTGKGKWNASSRTYEMPNGSRIMFFGLDPDLVTGLPRIGSVELGWAFVDEAAECSEADWVQIMGRLSWPGIDFHQISAATNPASPQHWLKRRFTPPTDRRVYLHARTTDNPTLPADYLETALSTGDSYFRQRYIEGEWTAAEGAIWTLPDDQVRTVPRPFRRVVAGVDWGYVHPFACEVVGVSGEGRPAVVDEAYMRGRTLAEIIPVLQFLRDAWGIETFYADPSEPANIAECKAAGLPMTEAANAVIPGITAVSQAIKTGLTVAPNCSGLLGEIPGYVWAHDRSGMTERPVEVGDDACDALRYAIFGMAQARRGWGAVTGSAGGTT